MGTIKISDAGRGTTLKWERVGQNHALYWIKNNAGYHTGPHLRKLQGTQRGEYIVIDGKRCYLTGMWKGFS